MEGVADDRPTPPQPPADDETARFDQPIDQPPDETAVMPAAGERPAGEQPARWAARAGGPAAGQRRVPGRYRDRVEPAGREQGAGGYRGQPRGRDRAAVTVPRGVVTGARYRLGGAAWACCSPSSWTKMDRRSTASPALLSSYP